MNDSKKGTYNNSAKIWLDTFEVSDSGNLSLKEINLVLKLIKFNKFEIAKAIAKFKAGKKVKAFELKLK